MQALLVLVPALVSGALLVHLLWPAQGFPAWVLKCSLGVGVGLGLRSLLFFIYLLLLPATKTFIYIELAALALLVLLTLRRHPAGVPGHPGQATSAGLSGAQRLFLLFGLAVFVASLAATANYLLRRRQGDWDAWMMYNRAARFLYYDQANWKQSFSPQMDPLFHADYPLLLAGNIAAGWEEVGRDTAALPMLQSALFAVACAGLMVGALAVVKSVGQAALGLVLLWGIPAFVNEGGRQMADVPMAFFILGTGSLLYLYALHRGTGLLGLAGLAASLAAWTKNEGAVLVIGAITAVAFLHARGADSRRAWAFFAGLALPIAVTVYFKLFLAPFGDILTGASEGALLKAVDFSRHAMILKEFWAEFRSWGSWGIGGLSLGILPILLVYGLAFRSPSGPTHGPALSAGIAILVVQSLGYYAAYVVTPYELAWHLGYSAPRIVLQMFPLALFLVLSASRPPELVFGSRLPTDST